MDAEAPLIGNGGRVTTKRFMITGVIQIILGAFCILAGLVSGLVVWQPNYGLVELLDRSYMGVWTGLFFICCGIIGFRRQKRPLGFTITYLVLAILSAVLAFLGVAVMGMSLLVSILEQRTNDHLLLLINWIANGILVLTFSVEFIVSIVAASFSCSSLSRKSHGL